MDNEPEDWEKLKRIRAEKEKAARDTIGEDKANLQYLDPKSFAVSSGFTHNIEAYRVGSERISNIALFLMILGVIADALFLFIASHLGMGLVDMLPAKIDDAIYVILILAPTVAAVFAIIVSQAASKQKFTGPIVTSAITIVISLVWQSIRIIITGI